MLFTNLIYEGLLRTYPHQSMERELFDLIHYREKRKVDHPPVIIDKARGVEVAGTKDIMDAVVGSVWNAFTKEKIDYSGLAEEFRDVTKTLWSEDEEDNPFEEGELTDGLIVYQDDSFIVDNIL